jgi:putative peptidoglycan lipid II flippase
MKDGLTTTSDERPPVALSSPESIEDGQAGAGSTLAAVGRSALILTGGMVMAQVVILVRELFVAGQTGASSGFDALIVGIALPTALGGVLTAGTTVALVPTYLSLSSERDRSRALWFAGYVLTWVAMAGLLLWLALTLLAEQIVAVAGSGLTTTSEAEAVGYLRVVAPSVFVYSVYGILTGVCQAEERFAPLAASTVGIAAASVAVTLALWDQLGLTAYAVGSLAGPIVGVLVVAIALGRHSLLPRPRISTPNEGLRSYLGQALPLTISASILQFNAVIATAFASTLSEGSVASLRFGHLLVVVPIGAISVAWGKAIYPQLVKTTLGDGGGRMRLGALTSVAVRFAAALFVPVAMLTAAVAPLATAVVFGRGQFDAEDIERTAIVVAGYAPLIVLSLINPPLVSALNARRKANVLLAGGIINVTANLVLTVTLGSLMGIIGVALSTSITSGLIAVFFSQRVRRLDDTFLVRPVLRVLGLGTFAAAPGAFVAAWLAWSRWDELGTVTGVALLAVIGIAGMAAYVVIARAVRLKEPLLIVRSTGRFVMRRVGH